MGEEQTRSLNHFAGFSMNPTFWGEDKQTRTKLLDQLEDDLRSLIRTFYIYQVYPSSTAADLMIWSAAKLEDDGTTREFMNKYAQATNKARAVFNPEIALWGFTAPSSYSRARSAQEIDPFDSGRGTYLAIYPFVKTEEWYMLSRDARQGMMNEHIRLGKQYTAIRQLLLYSFGIQDQEFVVVYEMEDLPLFSQLVQELRSTDARVYTRRDTPLYTGVLQPPDDPLRMWKGE